MRKTRAAMGNAQSAVKAPHPSTASTALPAKTKPSANATGKPTAEAAVASGGGDVKDAAGLHAVWDVLERRASPNADGANGGGAASCAEASEWSVTLSPDTAPIGVKVLSRAPPVVLLSDFLSAAETALIIRICEPLFSPSVVGLPEEDGYLHDNRTSYSVHEARLPGELRRAIELRAIQFCGTNHGGVEYLEVIRYLPKQHFREHHDGVHRRFSFVVYLNTLGGLHDGGETAFPALGLEVKPKRGSALLFASTKPAAAVNVNASAVAPHAAPPSSQPNAVGHKAKTASASGDFKCLSAPSAATATLKAIAVKETPSKAVSASASASSATGLTACAAAPSATKPAVRAAPSVVEDPLTRHESRDPTATAKYALSIFVKQPPGLLPEDVAAAAGACAKAPAH